VAVGAMERRGLASADSAGRAARLSASPPSTVPSAKTRLEIAPDPHLSPDVP
jgi:hypothetical protein